LVSLTGAVGSPVRLSQTPSLDDNPLAAAFDGTNYLVVWDRDTRVTSWGRPIWNVCGRLVSSAGSAEGWGTFRQSVENGSRNAEVAVRSGKLRLRTIALESSQGESVRVRHGERMIEAKSRRENQRVLISLSEPVEIAAGEKLLITIG
jgi:hypothetical protein